MKSIFSGVGFFLIWLFAFGIISYSSIETVEEKKEVILENVPISKDTMVNEMIKDLEPYIVLFATDLDTLINMASYDPDSARWTSGFYRVREHSDSLLEEYYKIANRTTEDGAAFTLTEDQKREVEVQLQLIIKDKLIPKRNALDSIMNNIEL